MVGWLLTVFCFRRTFLLSEILLLGHAQKCPLKVCQPSAALARAFFEDVSFFLMWRGGGGLERCKIEEFLFLVACST